MLNSQLDEEVQGFQPQGKSSLNSDSYKDSYNNLSTADILVSKSSLKSETGKTFLIRFAFSRRQWIYLGLFGAANLFRAVSVLIAGPFYPDQAEERNVTDSQLGYVFASYDFSTFLTVLFFGKFIIPKLGPHVVFKICILNLGICTILFGLLDLVEDHKWFLALSFVIRIIAGAGDAGVYPSAFTIFATEFPNQVSTAIGLLEFLFGVGAALGPIVFGAVIDDIGFLSVYAIVGSLIFVSGLLVHFFVPNPLPSTQEISSEELDFSSNGEDSPKWWGILLMPELIVVVFSLFTAAGSIGFITASLEGHLDNFYLSSFQVSAVFIISNTIYTITSPIWGVVGDKLESSKHPIILTGATLIGLGFAFLGPLPFLSSERILWTTLLGLGFHGLGIGGAVMTAFPHATQVVMRNGYPDTQATYSLISSLYILTFTLGNAGGAAISGVLVENLQFQWATLLVIGLAVITVLSSAVFSFTKRR